MNEITGIIGRGRVGTALASALRAAGAEVAGPLGRNDPYPAHAAVVILAVPDGAIADVAARVPPGPLLAHCAASVPLSALGDREGFTMHPLLAVTGHGTRFAGAGCAIAGTSAHAVAAGERLARLLGMRVAEVADADRALYHAAASLASNFLVTLGGEAERLMAEVGVDRAMLVPLVRGAVEAWATGGARDALTGPIARGDEATVRRQRDALVSRCPELLPVWDALVARTRALAARREAPAARGGAPG